MQIVIGYPPNYDEIIKVFRPIPKGVIFCWRNTIFNPGNIDVTYSLLAHEKVHRARQGGDTEGWWRQYLMSPMFRLREEIPAHHAEYLEMLKDANRNDRRRALKVISGRLSGRLYGGLVSRREAQRLVLKGAME